MVAGDVCVTLDGVGCGRGRASSAEVDRSLRTGSCACSVERRLELQAVDRAIGASRSIMRGRLPNKERGSATATEAARIKTGGPRSPT